jgi:hypothetical protein
MNCPLCQSIDRVEFDAEMVINAEMVIHFSGLRNIGKRDVLAFPKISACLDCGFLTCSIPETELLELGESNAPLAPNGQLVDRACEIVRQQSAQVTTARAEEGLK